MNDDDKTQVIAEFERLALAGKIDDAISLIREYSFLFDSAKERQATHKNVAQLLLSIERGGDACIIMKAMPSTSPVLSGTYLTTGPMCGSFRAGGGQCPSTVYYRNRK